MNARVVLLLLLSPLGCLIPRSAQAQFQEMDRMYLVLVDVDKAEDIPLCYTNRFDQQQAEIVYAFEDTINYLADFIYEEDALHGPDCFVPDLKLVYRKYTYVFSLYCSKAIKYQNVSPYKASPQRVRNDLILTESVLAYLKRLKAEHFPSSSDQQTLLGKVVASEPLEELSEDESDLDALLEDDFGDEEEDLDLEEEKARRILPEEAEVELEEDIDDPW